jgi:hypothetical protein
VELVDRTDDLIAAKMACANLTQHPCDVRAIHGHSSPSSLMVDDNKGGQANFSVRKRPEGQGANGGRAHSMWQCRTLPTRHRLAWLLTSDMRPVAPNA